MKPKLMWFFIICVLTATLFGPCINSWAALTRLYVTSDTHLPNNVIYTHSEDNVSFCIRHINSRCNPANTAVITCGDLCDGGRSGPISDDEYYAQWLVYDHYLPKDGGTGINQCKYPNYATAGNHDYLNFGSTSVVVSENLCNRYYSAKETGGNVFYSVNFGGIHLVSLGRETDSVLLGDLAEDLNSYYDVPTVLFQHYQPDQSLAAMLAGDNIFGKDFSGQIRAILCGHTHIPSWGDSWNGYPLYNPGATCNKDGFGILDFQDGSMIGSVYVPEPATLILLGLGGLMIVRRRRQGS